MNIQMCVGRDLSKGPKVRARALISRQPVRVLFESRPDESNRSFKHECVQPPKDSAFPKSITVMSAVSQNCNSAVQTVNVPVHPEAHRTGISPNMSVTPDSRWRSKIVFLQIFLRPFSEIFRPLLSQICLPFVVRIFLHSRSQMFVCSVSQIFLQSQVCLRPNGLYSGASDHHRSKMSLCSTTSGGC